jgi:hypothetical protein
MPITTNTATIRRRMMYPIIGYAFRRLVVMLR